MSRKRHVHFPEAVYYVISPGLELKYQITNPDTCRFLSNVVSARKFYYDFVEQRRAERAVQGIIFGPLKKLGTILA
jgi:hypothetical protein